MFNPNGPNIAVQNGEQRGSDAAHSGNRDVVDYRSQATAKTPAVATQQYGAVWYATHTVLPAGVAGRRLCNLVLSVCWLCS